MGKIRLVKACLVYAICEESHNIIAPSYAEDPDGFLKDDGHRFFIDRFIPFLSSCHAQRIANLQSAGMTDWTIRVDSTRELRFESLWIVIRLGRSFLVLSTCNTIV